MTATLSILLAVVAALFMAKLARSGASANLRAAVRTTVVLVMGWSLACVAERPIVPHELPRRVWLMLALSVLAVALAWLLYLRGMRSPDSPPVALADRVNVIIAVLFAGLWLSGDSAPNIKLGVLLLIVGAVILAWNRN